MFGAVREWPILIGVLGIFWYNRIVNEKNPIKLCVTRFFLKSLLFFTMDELTNILIYGVLWWDACCVTTLITQHYNASIADDINNFYNWHEHINNIFAIREQYEIALENCNAFKEVLTFGDTQITLDEENELARLENKKKALELQIIEEQKADIKEQQNKTIKRLVYPTLIVAGLKLAWSFGSWVFSPVGIIN